MTVAVPGNGDIYAEYAGIGTEDLDASDFGIARWKIDHNDGVFVNNQNGLAYEELDVILLAVNKQRVMFDPVLNDESKDPWCKSNNHSDGYPGEEFPWNDYAFGMQDAPLPCASCNFAVWGPRDPVSKKSEPPMCNELYTFTFQILNAELEGTPGLISLKGTSISPAKKYIAPFVQRRQPLFLNVTRITLTKQMYTGRAYYVAKFDMGEKTDPTHFPEYSAVAMSARDFLTQPPFSGFAPLEIAGEIAAPTEEYIEEAEVVEPTPAPATAPQQARVRPNPAPEPVSAPEPAPAPAATAPRVVTPVTRPTPVASAPRVVTPVTRPAPVQTAPVSPQPTTIDDVVTPDPSSVVVEGEVPDDELPF